MILHAPFLISARLLPALKLGDAWLHLESAHHSRDEERRCVASFIIDFPDGTEYVDRSLKSGVGGLWQPVDAFEAFLSFLVHAASSDDEEAQALFPAHVVQWARDSLSELESAQCDIQDENGNPRPNLLVEEGL